MMHATYSQMLGMCACVKQGGREREREGKRKGKERGRKKGKKEEKSELYIDTLRVICKVL